MFNEDLLAVEHHRLHIIEQWPEGAKKDAALVSVRSAIHALEQQADRRWACIVCGRRTLDFIKYELPKAA